MDAIDKKIIEMLRKNAREAFATIGKSVELSAPAVGKRVKQLEEKGIILGYSLKLDHEKLGTSVKAYIILKIHQSSTVRTAYNQIVHLEEVQRCDRITGEDSLCILGYFKTTKELVTFIERISQYGVPNTKIILQRISFFFGTINPPNIPEIPAIRPLKIRSMLAPIPIKMPPASERIKSFIKILP